MGYLTESVWRKFILGRDLNIAGSCVYFNFHEITQNIWEGGSYKSSWLFDGSLGRR